LPQCIYDKYRASATALTAWFKIPKAVAAGVETFSAQANRPVVLFFYRYQATAHRIDFLQLTERFQKPRVKYGCHVNDICSAIKNAPPGESG
jgi:hypothetical protein